VLNARAEAALATVTLSAAAARRLGLQTTPATEQIVARTRTVGGEVMAPPGRAVVVSAPVAGTVGGAGVQAGARVGQGHVVLDLLPLQAADRDLRLDAERAAQETAARLSAASQRLRRLEQLLADGSASARSVEEARADLAVARAQADAADARWSAIARAPLGDRGELTLAAPFDGIVLALHAVPGQTVAPSTPLFEIADLSEVWIRVPLYVGELRAIDAGQPAGVATLDEIAPGRWLPASRVAGPPSADARAASADLFYAMPNPDTLRPGERVAVRLALLGTERALVVPVSAIVYDLDGGAWVYEADSSLAYVRRRVEVRDEVADLAIITRGLEVGTAVVTTGAAELYGMEFGVGK